MRCFFSSNYYRERVKCKCTHWSNIVHAHSINSTEWMRLSRISGHSFLANSSNILALMSLSFSLPCNVWPLVVSSTRQQTTINISMQSNSSHSIWYWYKRVCCDDCALRYSIPREIFFCRVDCSKSLNSNSCIEFGNLSFWKCAVSRKMAIGNPWVHVIRVWENQ